MRGGNLLNRHLQKVHVNAVAPGYIHTEMIGMLDHDTFTYVRDRINLCRLGMVDDVAPLVCFLLLDKAAYITGRLSEWVEASPYNKQNPLLFTFISPGKNNQEICLPCYTRVS